MRITLRAILGSVGAAVVLMGAAASSTVLAQDYPSQPLHVFTSEAGGSADISTRIVAEALAPALGQPVVVENYPGGIIVAENAANAAPDGYNVIYAGTSFMFAPFFSKTPYDPVADFAPVTIVAKSSAALAVNASVPVNTLQELIDLAKSKPGEINYGSATTGSGSHISMELLKSMAGIDLTRIAYKGGGAALTALLGGEVQVLIADPSVIAPHVQSGELKALAVTGTEASALLPGVPTVSETVPGYVWETIDGIWAPKGTPDDVVKLLNEKIVAAITTQGVKDKYSNNGLEIVASTPEELAARMQDDIGRVGKLVKEIGITPAE